MTGARVTAVGRHGVTVEYADRTLQARPGPEGLRVHRNWREANPSVRDLLALVEAMAAHLISRGEWSPTSPISESEAL